MTTIMDQLEAPVRVNGNHHHLEWAPAIGFDETGSGFSSCREGRGAPEPPRGPKPPSVQSEQQRKNFQLDEPLRTEHQFEGIIGCSASLGEAFAQLEIVAPTDSTVLLLGETGTGKEMAARALHNRSPRRERTFVRVNCAAIPSGLFESELFGHERGAFTSAIARKIGRFELANGGTIFLDEVGDIPPELQPKLLRVLQEQEFERLGSPKTIRVDVRVVAASSRDLPQMVADREFRADLYYRLNVFPIRLPALRERLEDIPLLVRHFTASCAARMRKSLEHVSLDSLNNLLRYSWPGNVRELQNLIERAVIFSPGKVLRLSLAEPSEPEITPGAARENDPSRPLTLKDAEREHIIQALAETNWIVGGSRGAAARLGLPRTTLNSKMQKLGISRASFGRTRQRTINMWPRLGSAIPTKTMLANQT